MGSREVMGEEGLLGFRAVKLWCANTGQSKVMQHISEQISEKASLKDL